MSFTDCLLLSLINAGVCIALPKMLHLAATVRIKRPAPAQLNLEPQVARF